jgi:uncharacterized membrane protein YoaK (UPF0700 family)
MAGDVHGRRMVVLLLVLSATTGLIDAVSVLGLGKVFTANMTGNIVFLGFALARVPGFSWQTCLVALSAFLIGAGIAARLCNAHQGRSRRRWLLLIATGEALLLWAAAAIGLAVGPRFVLLAQLAMVACMAMAMGARNATVRQLKVPDLTTTVLTLTVTGIAADSSFAGGTNPNLLRRILAVVAILVGAIIGALLMSSGGIAAPLVLAGVVELGATVFLVQEEEKTAG